MKETPKVHLVTLRSTTKQNLKTKTKQKKKHEKQGRKEKIQLEREKKKKKDEDHFSGIGTNLTPEIDPS